MKQGQIIILGANPSSEALVATLNRYGHQLTVIDQDSAKLQTIRTHHDINTLCDFPAYPQTLQQIDLPQASALIALTDSDETNLIASHIATSLDPNLTCITGVQTDAYQGLHQIVPTLNNILSYHQSIYDDIQYLISYPGYNHINTLNNDYVSASLAIDEDHPLLNKTLEEVNASLPKQVTMAGLRRHGKWAKFRSNIKLAPHDDVLFIMHKHKLMHFQPKHTQNINCPILILGISHLTTAICNALQDTHPITVIAAQRQLCENLSMQFPNINIINDNPQEQSVLLNNHVDKSLVIAASCDDEDNLIYSFQAHDTQALQIFTLLNHIREGHVFEKGPIDYTIIAPQIISDEVIRDLLSTKNVNHFYTKSNYVQITEVFLNENHPYVGKTIKELQLPQDVFVGGIIRDSIPLFTSANTTIQQNDSIVLYSNHQKGTQNILEMMFLSTEYLLT